MAKFQRVIVNRLQYLILVVKYEKYATFIFYEKDAWKTLEFGHMHKNNIFFVYIFLKKDCFNANFVFFLYFYHLYRFVLESN